MDNEKAILELMSNAGKPLKMNDLEVLSGLTKGVVEKAFKNLKNQNLIVSPERCKWEPAKK